MTRTLAAMTSSELADRLADEPAPVVLLVLGATEAHGPHLPLETDTVIGLELAERTAQALEQATGAPGLVAPAFTTTAAACAEGFPGTVSVPRETEAKALAATLEALIQAGAARVCLITVHFDPEHTAAVGDALDALGAADRACVLYPRLTRRANVERIGGEFATGDCHAGRFETSLVLAADPGLVDPSYTTLAPNEVGLVQALQAGQRSFEEIGMPEAYCGSPGEASAEEGERLYDVLVEILVEACQERWGPDKDL